MSKWGGAPATDRGIVVGGVQGRVAQDSTCGQVGRHKEASGSWLAAEARIFRVHYYPWLYLHLIKVHFVKYNDQSIICLLHKRRKWGPSTPHSRENSTCKHGAGLHWFRRTRSVPRGVRWTLLFPQRRLTLFLSQGLRAGVCFCKQQGIRSSGGGPAPLSVTAMAQVGVDGPCRAQLQRLPAGRGGHSSCTGTRRLRVSGGNRLSFSLLGWFYDFRFSGCDVCLNTW